MTGKVLRWVEQVLYNLYRARLRARQDPAALLPGAALPASGATATTPATVRRKVAAVAVAVALAFGGGWGGYELSEHRAHEADMAAYVEAHEAWGAAEAEARAAHVAELEARGVTLHGHAVENMLFLASEPPQTEHALELRREAALREAEADALRAGE